MKLAFISCLILIWKISNANDQLSDFPACGFRNEASTVHPFIPNRVQRRDECLWDCDWVDNPFYRTNWTINLVDNYLKNPENPNENVVFEDVKYFMMTPKIPKNLTCLDGCRLQEVVSQNRVNCKPTRISKKDYKDLQTRAFFSAGTKDNNWMWKGVWGLSELLS